MSPQINLTKNVPKNFSRKKSRHRTSLSRRDPDRPRVNKRKKEASIRPVLTTGTKTGVLDTPGLKTSTRIKF